MSSQQGQFREFHTSRLTPNDRVFITTARAKITTQAVMAFGGIFCSMWLYRRVLRPKKGRIILPTFLGLAAAVPLTAYNVRNEYRRAIVELHDDSYLRKFLFDAAVMANPDLNAQQIYSRVAIEEQEKKQQQLMLEQQRMQSLQQSATDQDYRQYQQKHQQQQIASAAFDHKYNQHAQDGRRNV